MSETTGEIQAKSEHGIKIDDEWYNTKDEQTLLLVERGETVTVIYEDNTGKNGKVYHNITEIKQWNPKSPEANHISVSGSPKKYLGVTVGMAINNAAAYLNTVEGSPNNGQEWAEGVVVYAKALLVEMEKEGL